MGVVALHGLIAILPANEFPPEADLSLSLPVLLFSLAASTLAGLLFGCAPAWYATRVELGDSLKEGGRSGTSAGRHRLRRLLVIGEFALALTLLTGAGMAIHSFWNLTHLDLGVVTTHIETFLLPVSDTRLRDRQQITAYYQQMLGRIKALPGVLDASASTGLPLERPGPLQAFVIEGQGNYDVVDPSKWTISSIGMVTPDYFRTFGIQVLRGRAITEQDHARVVMVNEEFAKKYLPGQDPLQHRILLKEQIPGSKELGPLVSWQIVGVFHNVPRQALRNDRPEIDVPFWQTPMPAAYIGIRTSGDPEIMRQSIAAAVHSVDPQIAVADPRTMDEVKSMSVADDRFTMMLFGSFAVVAQFLAGVGIYGVMDFTVAQREQEIGLRMALGASRRNVMAIILRETLMLSGIGLTLGVVGAYLVGKALHSTLYGVGSMDFAATGAVAMVMVGAALMASWVPARRAAALQPMRALRAE